MALKIDKDINKSMEKAAFSVNLSIVALKDFNVRKEYAQALKDMYAAQDNIYNALEKLGYRNGKQKVNHG